MSANSPIDSSIDPVETPEAASVERNWIPLAVACVLVLAVVAAVLVMSGRRKQADVATPVNAASDPYAASLQITNLAMSESANLAGGKVTYIDGHIANTGGRTVTGILVQVLFRNGAQEVAQNSTMPLTVIRMREPYVDTAQVAASPLKPGPGQDFRLIFDSVAPDWAGGLPQVRVVRVQFQ